MVYNLLYIQYVKVYRDNIKNILDKGLLYQLLCVRTHIVFTLPCCFNLISIERGFRKCVPY